MKKILIKYYQNKKIAVIIASIFTAIILILCLWPSEAMKKVNAPLSDKWAHFIVFAGFSFLWLSTFRRPRIRQYLIVILSGFLFGYMIELLQLSLTFLGRSYEFMDFIADGLGTLIGSAVFFIFYRTVITPSLSRHQL